MTVKKGQVWESKNSSKTIRIVRRFSGNKHWTVEDEKRKNTSHKIHEGTLTKYYDLLK
jgi:hypothetical protein